MESRARLAADEPRRVIAGGAWDGAGDGEGAGRIELGGGAIRICRRIAGLDAFVNVPLASYRGVTLRIAASGACEVALLHVDPALDLVLARTPDDSEVIALWRRYGRTIGLPLLVEDADGRLATVEERSGSESHARRGGSPLKGRRPRFLARRAVGAAAP
jgi:Family of unknown function (DUF6101)